MVLTLADISHDYGGQRVLDHFTLDLPKGRHSLLLGPSGSGKTTLINLIAGLLTPKSGSVTVGGETMSTLKPAARDDLRRRRIGLIFQTLRLVSALDLRSNLLLAQRLSGTAHDGREIDALLDRLDLGHRAKGFPRELSQGEAQRAAIARALIGKPDLLIADEPTSALDDANMTRVAKLLIETADANGSTLLIATHDARLREHIPGAIRLTPLAMAA